MHTSDRERMAQLISEKAAALTLYARQWLDAAGAEDVVQEALTALLMERQPPDDAIAWMYRAVRNAAIDGARSASRRKRREQIVAKERSTWFETATDSLMDARAAEEALRDLSPNHREIVVMRIWGDLSFPEIARILRMGVSTVHEHYGLALQQVRKRLEKSCKMKD